MSMVRRNYNVKVDDMLLHLLNEYHNIDASDATSWFCDRVEEMKDLQPNITSKSRSSNIKYDNLDKRTVQAPQHKRAQYDPGLRNNFYVLRGFYPNTSLPFKLIAVYSTLVDMVTLDRHNDKPLHVKVIMGMKPHHSVFNSNDINDYREAVSEAILLDQPVRQEEKIKYKYRDFRCMRPKGMELYHERNYEEKQKLKAAERRKAKNDK